MSGISNTLSIVLSRGLTHLSKSVSGKIIDVRKINICNNINNYLKRFYIMKLEKRSFLYTTCA